MRAVTGLIGEFQIALRGGNRAAERVLLETWGDYYVEAMARITELVVGRVTINDRVRAMADAMKRRTDMVVRGLP